MTAWRYLSCYCHDGLIGGWDGYPRDCPSCNGMGGVYITQKGARALWPGGPLHGRSTPEEWERAEPVKVMS